MVFDLVPGFWNHVAFCTFWYVLVFSPIVTEFLERLSVLRVAKQVDVKFSVGANVFFRTDRNLGLFVVIVVLFLEVLSAAFFLNSTESQEHLLRQWIIFFCISFDVPEVHNRNHFLFSHSS